MKILTIDTSPAPEKGAEAHADGFGRDDNPWMKGSHNYHQWDREWSRAQRREEAYAAVGRAMR